MTPLRRAVMLLPGHGPEDLPEEFDDADAESLLAMAAVALDPRLLAACDDAARWDRADDPPPVHEGSVVLVPPGCVDLVPDEWRTTADERGAIRIEGHRSRAEWVTALESQIDAAPSEAAIAMRPHFHALGACVQHLTRLARRLHIFDDIDGDRVFRAAREAATADTPGDAATALTRAFDSLLEFRERLYPVEAGLLDVVLIDPEQPDALAARIAGADRMMPINLMGSVDEFEAVADAIRGPLAAAGDAVDLIVSEPSDHPTMLTTLDRTARTLAATHRRIHELFGRRPRNWGRRDLALRAQLPTVLKSCGFTGALHVGFDLGEFPDEEDARLDWIGLDRTSIAAISRLPLPSARASSMWTFPVRLGESMELDYSAVAMLVGFCEPPSEWLEDLRIASTYGPIFGPLTTMSEYLADGGGGSRQLKPKASEYRAATLLTRAARRDSGDAAIELADGDAAIELADGDATVELTDCPEIRGPIADCGRSVAAGLVELATGQRPEADAAAALAERIASPAAEPEGMLVLNPAPFERVERIRTPRPLAGELAGLQAATDDGYDSLVRVPPLGYAFVPFAADGRIAPSPSKTPTAEDRTLRNEFFEVTVSERTGGIAAVRAYGTRGNLLSQRLVVQEEGEREASSQMVAESVRLTGDAVAGRADSTGTIESYSGQPIARFTQRVEVVRASRRIGVEIMIEPPGPDATALDALRGGPWSNYLACQWAWAASAAPLTQSSDWDAAAVTSQRFEAPLFVEIGDEPRLTICPRTGLFHRRSGGRMLDSLLRVKNSPTGRRDGFGVWVGNPHPAEASAADAFALQVARSRRPATDSAWLAQVSQPGVVLLGIEPSPNPRQRGFVLTVRETEGRRGTCRLAICRTVTEAFTLDWLDRPQGTLAVIDGAVELPLRGHDLKRVFVAT